MVQYHTREAATPNRGGSAKVYLVAHLAASFPVDQSGEYLSGEGLPYSCFIIPYSFEDRPKKLDSNNNSG